MFKLAIIGGRDFHDYSLMCKFLDPHKDSVSEVISGGAKGADSLGYKWAIDNNIPTTIFKPDWELHGKRAGFIRNADIVNGCDRLIAFWDGKSKGTANSIQLTKKQNKPINIIFYAP